MRKKGWAEPNWKYFKAREVAGLVDDLVSKLDRAREFYGNPIVITSGFRTAGQNDAANGVRNSSHLMGLAADIAGPTDASERERLAWALGAAGFRRIGTYRVRKHFHVDIDPAKPTPAFWVDD